MARIKGLFQGELASLVSRKQLYNEQLVFERRTLLGVLPDTAPGFEGSLLVGSHWHRLVSHAPAHHF